MFASERKYLHSHFGALGPRSNPRKIGAIALVAILSFVGFSVQAQSPASASGDDSALTSSATVNARQAYDEGLRAEKSADWEVAFQAYQQAAVLSPRDRAIQLRVQLARSALAQQRTEQAERQLISGNPALARAMLQSAIQVDPSYTVAQERLQQLSDANPFTGIPGENLASALPAIKAAAGKHDFDFNGATHGAYQEVARQFGVTAAFDPEPP